MVTENVGEVENKGLELSIATDNFSGRSLTWNTRFNLSINRNKVLKLYNGQPIDDLGRGSNRIQEELIGIFSERHDWASTRRPATLCTPTKISTANLPPRPPSRDNPHPDFIGGITNTLGYRGFDLSFFFQGSYGNDMFNGSRRRNRCKAATTNWL